MQRYLLKEIKLQFLFVVFFAHYISSQSVPEGPKKPSRYIDTDCDCGDKQHFTISKIVTLFIKSGEKTNKPKYLEIAQLNDQLQ